MLAVIINFYSLTEYDLCLTNTADNPVLLHNLNQHTDLSKLTFSTMVKKTTESFGFGIDFDDHTAELDESSVTIWYAFYLFICLKISNHWSM